ncbi:GntR family transcriptional regulator [Streptomyces sp. NPDC093097]|uniref:GntR family transcriptional regulator n=1 Tax=Streptomyces sp. NPDC093097 TaxID=3366027 RepID=UPI0037F40ABD
MSVNVDGREPKCRGAAPARPETGAAREQRPGGRGSGENDDHFPPLRRHGVQRLAWEQWGAGRSIWWADIGERELIVDQVAVHQAPPPADVAAALGMEPAEPACVRSRRFVLDGKPVLLATSFLPADLVAGSAIAQEDTGPGGLYARLAELGRAPRQFREEIRSRMPSRDEANRLRLSAGTPVFLITRIAFMDGGRPVEVNEMILDAAAYVLEYAMEA